MRFGEMVLKSVGSEHGIQLLSDILDKTMFKGRH
jgi:hypothetical protein